MQVTCSFHRVTKVSPPSWVSCKWNFAFSIGSIPLLKYASVNPPLTQEFGLFYQFTWDQPYVTPRGLIEEGKQRHYGQPSKPLDSYSLRTGIIINGLMFVNSVKIYRFASFNKVLQSSRHLRRVNYTKIMNNCFWSYLISFTKTTRCRGILWHDHPSVWANIWQIFSI